MNKLSTGQDATLGNHRALAKAVFGPDSPAVTFLDQKILESPLGADEPVIVDERQMVHLLISLHIKADS